MLFGAKENKVNQRFGDRLFQKKKKKKNNKRNKKRMYIKNHHLIIDMSFLILM